MSEQGNPHPLSLSTLGEGRYKIIMDEAWEHEKLEFKRGYRHWYEIIPCCRIGVIYLYSEVAKLLALSTGKTIANKVLRGVKGAKLFLKTSEETVVLFPAEALHQVAKIASARRRRRLKPENREQFIASGSAYRFKAKNHGAQCKKSAQTIKPFFDVDKLRANGWAQGGISTENPCEPRKTKILSNQ